MGVHGLWDIVGPSARPVRVEGLRNKKLAVDASIWIYQFLKAVRDSEGNQMKNSHIVGFFRRICKLLYFGIKPVFVFDGGVPALKRATIRKRKERREGKKESVEQTAQKILAKQLQQYAEKGIMGHQDRNNKKRKDSAFNNNVVPKSHASRQEKPVNELYFDTYYDDLNEDLDETSNGDGSNLHDSLKPQKENESQMFRKQDDYDLPEIKGGIKVKQNDNRLMTDYEYDRLTKDINDDLDDIDLDRIDPQSEEFEKLPLSTQYIVLSHLRLRSRLRMGYTKSQLQSLFPDPMEFSKFQIKMVQKRNFFTQKIMNVTGMDSNDNEDVISRRIASDKNRAYNLKRTGDGYALSIEKKDGDTSDKPVVLDDPLTAVKSKVEYINDTDESEEDVEWDDVEIVDELGSENRDTSEKPVKADIKDALFIQDSDESDAENSGDEESLEMEDVPLAVENIDGDIDGDYDDKDDDVMQKIKYLYEYSNKHNKKKVDSNSGDVKESEKIIISDDDMDEYHEAQLKQIEDEELKRAIEKSKLDYISILNEEKQGNAPTEVLVDEPPIILSTSTLAKTLKIPNFSMKNNLLFGGSAEKNKEKINTNIYSKSENKQNVNDGHYNSDTRKKNPLPLPKWFSDGGAFTDGKESSSEKEPENKAKKEMTEDERAGLISYGDVGNYYSSDEDENVAMDDVEVIEIDALPKVEEIEDEPTSIVTEGDNLLKKEHIISIGGEEKDTESGEKPDVNTIETIRTDIKEAAISQNGIEERSNTNSNGERELINSESRSVNVADLLSGKTESTPRHAQLDDDFEFSDEEEVNLLLDMEEEDKAYSSFVNNLKGANRSGNSEAWSFSDEAKLQEQLNKQKRDADEVSTKMIYDVQDLLSRFGIPYITAPMEAEAQCAELKLLNLVDGIITDDSDCFLFGGDRIYKNLFSEKNFVECYQDDDIREELGLSRERMIELAILLGSDYTEGIKGVGKVTSMEILGEFKTLQNFRDWWMDYQNGKIDQSRDTPLRKKLRKTLANNLFLDEDFPNTLIYEAYLHPEVDHDKTAFKWGYPDLDKLRTFLMFYAGWNKAKIDEILLPVIQSMNKPQATIEEFFPVEIVQRRRKLDMSKRIKTATERLKKPDNKNKATDTVTERNGPDVKRQRN